MATATRFGVRSGATVSCSRKVRGAAHFSSRACAPGPLATLLYALATLALAHLRNVALLTGAMLLMGAAWVMVLSSLQVSVQTALPEWVRARGLSLYLVVFMGGMAGGSLLWGQLATQTGLVIALETATRRFGALTDRVNLAACAAPPWICTT